MRCHTPHPLLVAVLAVAAISLARGQTPSAPGTQEASVHTDAAGNLHVNSEINQTVFLNGMNVVGELAAVRAAVAHLQAATPGPRMFSNASQTKLTASDAAEKAQFGRSVAVDGATMVVGAAGDGAGGPESGAAYAFTLSNGVWTQQQKLTASDAAARDTFGYSVGVSSSTIVVGARFDGDGGIRSGSAYVYQRGGTTWTQQQKLTASDAAAVARFGESVAISGATIVVGAPFDDAGGLDSGSAYVYQRNGTTWTQQQKLTASDAAAQDEFGDSVAIEGGIIVVGAPDGDDDGTDSGAVYVYQRNGAVWTRQQKLTAADGAAGAFFGTSVSISGATLVVGASGDGRAAVNSGAAYIFIHNGTAWAQEAKLTASDATAGDAFGFAVGVHGTTIVVGALGDGDAGSRSGAAYIFTSSGGGAWIQHAKLTAADAAAGDQFGRSVAISGSTIVVAANEDGDAGPKSGSVYVF